MPRTHEQQVAAPVVQSLQGLVGGRIRAVVLGDAGFPALLVHANGADFWVDLTSDPEGNGPGYARVERVGG